MRLLSYLLVLLFCGTFTNLTAQRNCGSMDVLEQQLLNNPNQESMMRDIEEFTEGYISDPSRAVNGIITIPVVVHVVYNTATENISTSQIQSQIDILTEDFRRLNSDANGTWAQAADSEIEFCLATIDPSGAATTGITRTSTSVTSFSTNDNVKFNSTGGKDAWPAADYLNFWVCDLSGGLLGYAQFPGGAASTDGVVCDYQYVGNEGTATAPFNLGRTATHEVGHWLNLRHIWGDGGCSVDDFVSDTPTSDASNTGCATGHVSCGSTDMVENYMDYSDDACMNLYTEGQKTRMRALFDTGGFRESLLNSNGCGSSGPISGCTDPNAHNYNPNATQDDGSCETCNDSVQNGDETGVDCGGALCSPCPCTGTNVTLTIVLDNYPEETSWTLVNSGGTTVASGGTYGSLPDGSTVTETWCLPDGCYDFTINDAYGDGICCSYGNGSYNVSDDSGNTLASGGSFGSSETTNFCVGGGGGPVLGCTDPGAHNYDPAATQDDGSCETCSDGIQNGDETGVDCGGALCGACPIPGCTDPNAHNYNPNATQDDGSCETCNDGVQNGDETGVDCGGALCSECPCSGTDVTLTIVLDNYPEETSWTLVNSGGTTVASGGTYGSLPDGSTVTETWCLPDDCYDFTINDAYGDGICCSYGNGSYDVSDSSGNTLASGGSFGSSETTNFCLGGGGGPILGCTDPGAHNYDPAATQDDGSCETCSDGVQNGDETGTDCGGVLCAPCGGGGCTQTAINFNNFDSGWGIWNDGGSDCRRSANDAAYANSGSYCVRLRDNTSSSVMTTDNLNLSGYEEVTVDFNYLAVSMETGEDFWLQVSTNGGSSYQTVYTWASGTDFQNNVREFQTIVITGTFTSNTRIRFRCDASSNADRIYIDDVDLSGCVNGSNRVINEEQLADKVEIPESFDLVNVYPNPANAAVTLAIDSQVETVADLYLVDLSGKRVMMQTINTVEGKQELRLDVSQYPTGIYFLHMVSENHRVTKKLIIGR